MSLLTDFPAPASRGDDRKIVWSLPFLSRDIGPGLFAAVLALNVFLALLGCVALRYAYVDSTMQAETRSENLAEGLDQSFSHCTDTIYLSLRTATGELERQMAAGGIDRFLSLKLIDQQKAMLPFADGFSVTDSGGAVILHSGSTLPPHISLADREYFLALKSGNTPGVVFGKPVIDRASGARVVVFAHRYNHGDGRFAGIVLVSIPLSYFAQTLSGFRVGRNGVVELLDEHLALISRYPETSRGAWIAVGNQNASPALLRLVRSGASQATYHSISAYDRISRVYTFHRLAHAPFLVFSGIAEDDYLAGWFQLVEGGIALFLLFLAVTSASACYVYRFWRRQFLYSQALLDGNLLLEQAMHEVEQRDNALLAAQEVGGLGTYALDLPDGEWTSSAELDVIFGISPDYPHDLDGWFGLIHSEDRKAMRDYFRHKIVLGKQSFDREYAIVKQDSGERRWVHGLGKLEFDETGRAVRMIGAVQDVTERKQAEAVLRLTHETFLHSHEAIVVTDVRGFILEVNPAFTKMTGFSHAEALGQRSSRFSSGLQDANAYRQMSQALFKDEFWEGELLNRHKDGGVNAQFMRVSAVKDADGKISRFIALVSDVTELRESQSRMAYLAHHDRLTDLPNGTALADRCRAAIPLADRGRELLAVCYLDLDGFKPVNDQFGHAAGDRALVEAARRLRAHAGERDTVARMGGDEFVVLIAGLKDELDIARAVQRMLTAMSAPFDLGNREVLLTMSAGVALYPKDAGDADVLMRHANEAMFIAKRNGKNQMNFFDSERDRRLKARHELQARLRDALLHDEFRLYYQPKVDLRSGQVVGAEALIRWQHPEQGLVPPGTFLPAVENADFSIQLGEWVIRDALRQMSEWQAQSLEMQVSVNISGFHLQRNDFVARLSALLAGFPSVDPRNLELEILETTLMEDVDAVARIIDDCMALGVKFALDDFGTGYSSLTYFRRLPAHLLKIDQSFVRNMLSDAGDLALVESIVRLGHSFKRLVIAEGVESIAHGIPLLKFGCDQAQGYGIARPMPAAEVAQWIRNWQPAREWMAAS